MLNGFAYGNAGAIECAARMKRSGIRDWTAGLPRISPCSIEAMLKRMMAEPPSRTCRGGASALGNPSNPSDPPDLPGSAVAQAALRIAELDAPHTVLGRFIPTESSLL